MNILTVPTAIYVVSLSSDKCTCVHDVFMCMCMCVCVSMCVQLDNESFQEQVMEELQGLKAYVTGSGFKHYQLI